MITSNESPMMTGDTSGTIVKFFLGAEINATKTKDKGHTVHDEHEYIAISFAGDQTKEVIRVVNDEDKMRFQAQYGHWKTNSREAMDGTPLRELSFLSAASIADLNYHKVFNVEALAGLSDAALQGIGMGVQGWKNQAIKWLDATKDTAAAKKLADENFTLKTDLDAMKAQIAELSKMLEEKNTSKAKAA